MNKIEDIFGELEKNVNSDFLYDFEVDAVEFFESFNSKESFIEPIFLLMEKYPLADWGTPGPLVHFIESCDTKIYEELLLSSLKRQPAAHTVWMLNRTINVKKGEERQNYIDILKSIAENKSISSEISNHANDYLLFQLNKK